MNAKQSWTRLDKEATAALDLRLVGSAIIIMSVSPSHNTAAKYGRILAAERRRLYVT